MEMAHGQEHSILSRCETDIQSELPQGQGHKPSNPPVLLHRDDTKGLLLDSGHNFANRELQLDNEAIAMINKKWPKLNKTNPPSNVGISFPRDATQNKKTPTQERTVRLAESTIPK